MAITAAQVKELRERTGAGMMECKKALTETGGDIDAAIETMRKAGLAKADKKAGRTAAEGLVVLRSSDDGRAAALVEVNCETDFVAKGDAFQEFAGAVAQQALEAKPADLDGLLATPLPGGETVADTLKGLVAKLGENMTVRRFARFEGGQAIGAYLHGTRIGVLVEMEGGDEALARDVAMHVAASRPVCVNEDEVPSETLEKEKEIFAAQAAESGKPAEIIEKMVQGRVAKYLKEITLLGQPFVKDPDTTVGKLLQQNGATVKRFVRLEVGEGIEKKAENFAEEVMAQVRGN
ncbi:elongation factor Ts [Ectothiorhodospiraceae bacterium 2226]|nr:elongation factor Ts [Ectothiorhodospiraceae bacterium 2226]